MSQIDNDFEDYKCLPPEKLLVSGREAVDQQQPPVEGSGDIWREVIRDIEERRLFGIAKYKTPVQLDNGRDHIVDLYQELLDACVYTKQVIMRRNRDNATKTTIGASSATTSEQ